MVDVVAVVSEVAQESELEIPRRKSEHAVLRLAIDVKQAFDVLRVRDLVAQVADDTRTV